VLAVEYGAQQIRINNLAWGAILTMA